MSDRNTGVTLTQEQIKRLDRFAAEKGVSRSAVLRWAVDQYLSSLFLPDCNIDVTNETLKEQTTDLQTV